MIVEASILTTIIFHTYRLLTSGSSPHIIFFFFGGVGIKTENLLIVFFLHERFM